MVHDVDALDGLPDGDRIAKIADRDLDAGGGRLVSAIALEYADLMAARHLRTRQMAPGKTRRPGYEDAHRSATSVIGDPNKPSKPTRSRNVSMAVVNRRDPMAL